LRILQAIEKQRKVLSANNVSSILLEYLFNDEDLDYTMTRDEYEILISPVLQRFDKLMQDVSNYLKKRGTQLWSVEIIGGGSRIPIFREKIQKIIGLPPSTSLNGSESIARGSALQSAMFNSNIKMAKFILKE
jgi:heat shock protein 4